MVYFYVKGGIIHAKIRRMAYHLAFCCSITSSTESITSFWSLGC